MPKDVIRFPFAVAALLACGPAAAATAPSPFVKLADTNTPAGDGSNLRIFNTPQIGGATVVFIAQSQNGLTALYAEPAAGGPLVKLVDTNTKVPGGAGNFTVGRIDYFTPFRPGGCSAPVVGTTSAVFVGRDAAGNQGLYSVPLVGGRIAKLANWNTLIPGGAPPNELPNFNANYSFCNISVKGTRVVFDAGKNSGVYTVLTTGAHLARVADGNTPATAPQPFPAVTGFGEPTLAGTKVAYIGNTTGGPFGVYFGSTSGPGNPVITAAASEGNDFDQFAFPVQGTTNILFSANKGGNDSVLVTVGTAGANARIIFDTSASAVPKGARGSNFTQLGTDSENFLGNDGTRQIFSAIAYDAPPADYATYDGVFSSCKNKLSKLMETGDAIDTQQMRALGGISQLQKVSVNGVLVDQFAAMITLGPVGNPTIYNGSPALYTVNEPAC